MTIWVGIFLLSWIGGSLGWVGGFGVQFLANFARTFHFGGIFVSWVGLLNLAWVQRFWRNWAFFWVARDFLGLGGGKVGLCFRDFLQKMQSGGFGGRCVWG